MTHISEGVIVATGAGLTHVVMLLRVRFHGNLSVTSTTLEVEAVDFDSEVVLIEASLLTHVELGALVEEVATCFTTYAHGEHHADIVLLVARPNHFLQLRVVEVGRVILVQDLTLRHLIIASN